MGKTDSHLEDLEFKVSVFEARQRGEPDPKRFGDDCPGCGEPVVRSEDLRISHCENSKCKVMKVAV